MVNTSRRFKLEYTDSSGTVQTIAELAQDTGAAKIDNFVHIRRKNNPDILKVWMEGSDYENLIPVDKNDFGTASNGTNEPEIRLKQYNPDTDSFELKNRFYAKNKGSIDENNNLAVKLYSFYKYLGRQSVSTGTISDNNGNGTVDNEDAMNALLPKGYTVDVASGANLIDLPDYSLDSRREKGFHELTRDLGWALTFTGETVSGDAVVKYEPEGFGGTVDTIIPNSQASSYQIVGVDTTNDIFQVFGDVTNDLAVGQVIEVVRSTGNNGTYTISSLTYDSNNNETEIAVEENISDSTADGTIIPGGTAKFKSWEKDKTDAIINKVTVEGTNQSGQTVTGIATNQTMIDRYGEKFLKVKRGYLSDSTEAETIAEKYLTPGLNDDGTDVTETPESGTVKTSIYSDNIVNDSVQVVNNNLGIDDTYSVVQQRNHWPEGSSILEFEFEKENLEKAARESENLRDERARLFPGGSTNVGNQNLNVGDAEAQTSTSGENNTAEAQTSTSGENNTAEAQTSSTSSATEDALGFPGLDLANNGSVSFGSSLTQVAQVEYSGKVEAMRIYEASIFFNNTEHVRVRIEQGGATVYDTWHYTGSNQQIFIQAPFYPDSSIADSTARLRVESESGSNSTTGSGAFSIRYEQPHSHDISTTTTDSGHGAPGGPSEHIWSGTTTDSGHGAPGDPSEHIWTGNTVDSGHGSDSTDPHGGDTDAKNIDVAQEEKTDR